MMEQEASEEKGWPSRAEGKMLVEGEGGSEFLWQDKGFIHSKPQNKQEMLLKAVSAIQHLKQPFKHPQKNIIPKKNELTNKNH